MSRAISYRVEEDCLRKACRIYPRCPIRHLWSDFDSLLRHVPTMLLVTKLPFPGGPRLSFALQPHFGRMPSLVHFSMQIQVSFHDFHVNMPARDT
jgi:hypothetical protein